jgi:hypothetical protein
MMTRLPEGEADYFRFARDLTAHANERGERHELVSLAVLILVACHQSGVFSIDETIASLRASIANMKGKTQ